MEFLLSKQQKKKKCSLELKNDYASISLKIIRDLNR